MSERSLSYPRRVSPRAPRLSPDERRRAILGAAVPVLVEHGRATTTKQIAEAAGVAEGTIFRVFDTKEDLVDAALDDVFDPAVFLAALAAIDPNRELRARLLAITGCFQRRFVTMFRLMAALGLPPPAARHRGDKPGDWKQQAGKLMADLIGPDADLLRLPVDDVGRVIRLLTFAGSHPHISENRLLSPAEIVDIALDGVRLRDDAAYRTDSHPEED